LFEPRSYVRPSERPPFGEIYEVLNGNFFNLVEGNDVNEVLKFVGSLEASEYSGE
jgi:hypothetical protein